VTLWIGGFDLIYACQDIEVDRREGLHAVPARYGAAFALRLSAICHALTTVLLALVGFAARLAWPFGVGVVVAGVLLAYEHALVRADDLSRIDVAFFNVNGVISLTLFVATLASVSIS
jgi:4-hydroxybenzoate polyprenyltransferase